MISCLRGKILKTSRVTCLKFDIKINVNMTAAAVTTSINPLNPELNRICYLLALLGAHHFSTLAG